VSEVALSAGSKTSPRSTIQQRLTQIADGSQPAHTFTVRLKGCWVSKGMGGERRKDQQENKDKGKGR